MANMYNIDGLTYTARENPEWFTRAMFGGRLIQGGYLRALTGMKGDELLGQLDLENKVLQADGRDCAWTPNQIMRLSDKRASVKPYKINLEQCIDELEAKRTLYQLSPGAKNESLPADLEAATLALVAIGLSNEIEETLIGGDSAKNPDLFDGMEATLTKSKESIQLKGSALTRANIVAAFEAVYDAIPENVIQSEDAGTLYIFCSYAARRLLRNALNDLPGQNLGSSWSFDDADKRNPRIYYNGVEVVPVKGIGRNTVVAIDSKNAYMLTDLMSDLEEVELGNFPKPNDDKVFIKGRLRLGFVVPFEDEAVIMSTAITADRLAPGDTFTVTPSSLVFKAAGESKTFDVVAPVDAAVSVNGAPAGFTVTPGAPAHSDDGDTATTTVTVVAASNEGAMSPRVGQIIVSVEGFDREVTVTLNQRNEDVTGVVA